MSQAERLAIRDGSDRSLKVSYIMLDLSEQDNTLEKIASAINVQLSIDASASIPFIAPDNFSTASSQDKVFIYGPGGSGKSRTIFELVKSKLITNQGHSGHIFIINPRQNMENKIEKIDLVELVGLFAADDIVVWDNFPDDLLKKDPDNAIEALELVGLKNLKAILVALKPKYLETYRAIIQRVQEFYKFPLNYSPDKIKSILHSYGSASPQFHEVHKAFSKDLNQISKILWQKEPTPLMILNYYNSVSSTWLNKMLDNQHTFDAIGVARTLPARTDYYEKLFDDLINLNDRRSDVEFLYTLKTCYELALDRKTIYVNELQQAIFGSKLPDTIFQRLNAWVYSTGQYLAMHDVPREAVRLTQDARVKILNYLVDNISKLHLVNQTDAYYLGLFVGRNLSLAYEQNNSGNFLPESIYKYMKSQRYFESALGNGAGEVFALLDQELQDKILTRIEVDSELARGLGESLGNNFQSLDSSTQKLVLDKIRRSVLFARALGESLGRRFQSFGKSIRESVLQELSHEENYNFIRGFGEGIGHAFITLEDSLQERMFQSSRTNIPLAIGLGSGLGGSFTSFPIALRQLVLQKAALNGEMTRGIGIGLGGIFILLSDDLQKELLTKVHKSPALDFGLAYGIGHSTVRFLGDSTKDMFFKHIGQNSEFAWGAGWGLGMSFTYLSIEEQEYVIGLARQNMQFATGLGCGLGFVLQYLEPGLQLELFARFHENGGFRTGLGFGCAFTFAYINEDLKKKMFDLLEDDYRFSFGVGWGFGFSCKNLTGEMTERLLELADRNAGFASGYGFGLGMTMLYLSDELSKTMEKISKQNPAFARGFGMGTGYSFFYMPDELREDVIRKGKSNPLFGQGLGSELGYLYPYLSESFQHTILKIAENDQNIARGIGWGLGTIHNFLDEKTSTQVLQQGANRNPELMIGLGAGLGGVFNFLPVADQRALLTKAYESVHLAMGFGEGIGHILKYLDNDNYEAILSETATIAAFQRGLGIGTGKNFAFFSSDRRKDLALKMQTNVQFSIGLGQGIGQTVRYLIHDDGSLDFIRNSPMEFALGFGEGIGETWDYYPREVLQVIKSVQIEDAKQDYLARGLGRGVSTYLTCKREQEELHLEILLDINHHKGQFSLGLGEGTGRRILYTPEDIKKEIMQLQFKFSVTDQDKLAFGLGLGIGQSMLFLEDKAKLLEWSTKHHNVALGLGQQLGQSFPFISFALQELLLTHAKEDEYFAKGLGGGIGYSITVLDKVACDQIFEWMKGVSQFSSSLGQQLGQVFPSLPTALQESILQQVTDNPDFMKTLALALSTKIGYLDDDTVQKIKSHSALSSLVGPMSELQTHSEYLPEYNDFPEPVKESGAKFQDGLINADLESSEIFFYGKNENYCVCFIDMMNSTKVAGTLTDSQVSKYYSIFLNSMATIVKNFDGRIIKNAGDCLIYYFPTTADSKDMKAFMNMLECCMTMISAHRVINSKLNKEGLPPLNYRISADYGRVQVAKSTASQSDDLFGSTMNICAKINSLAMPNGLAVGEGLYQILRTFQDEYAFEQIGEYKGFKKSYPVYSVKNKKQRNIVNPFKRTS